jgi:F0F1-type ATP synthase epsilon subunit
MVDKPLQLKIHNREGLEFDGEVKNISSVNDKGKFDVLGYHANFISLINDYIIIRKRDGSEEKVNFDKAVMKVKDNLVEVYLGVKELETKAQRKDQEFTI